MKKQTVGVIVGRFQTPYLHTGHSSLIEYVSKKNDFVCIVIGTHGGVPTDRYPLDVETRSKMILAQYPSATIISIPDMQSNTAWSEMFDKKIGQKFQNMDITLYGSRDSFLTYYEGVYPYCNFTPVQSLSATQIREIECITPIDSEDFRKGSIYAATKRFPIVYSTVDIAPYRTRNGVIEILLGKKNSDGDFMRFVGGFVDPQDISHTQAAKRELMEEVDAIQIEEPEYIGSYKIDDCRYRGSQDSVITTLFKIKTQSENPQPKDDIDMVAWVPISKVLQSITASHKQLALELISSFKTISNN